MVGIIGIIGPCLNLFFSALQSVVGNCSCCKQLKYFSFVVCDITFIVIAAVAALVSAVFSHHSSADAFVKRLRASAIAVSVFMLSHLEVVKAFHALAPNVGPRHPFGAGFSACCGS